jgi:hypothetical protein
LDTAAPDFLELLDGGALHGALVSLDAERGVRWRHPHAVEPMEFLPRVLAQVRLRPVVPPIDPARAKGWFRFVNQDEILGALVALDAAQIEIEPVFGGRLRAPRSQLNGLSFFAQGHTVLYDGPNSFAEWKTAAGQKAWSYRDGSLVARGPGIIGRDLKLPPRARVQFDLSWSGQLALLVFIYTDSFERVDYNANAYLIPIGSGYVGLQRIQRGGGVVQLGQAQVPGMLRKGTVSIELRADLEEGLVALLADGALVQQWRDAAGFQAQGRGIAFYSQLTDASVRISNLKASDWDGNLETQYAITNVLRQDLVRLINKDRVLGEIVSMSDGKISVRVDQLTLPIPQARVTEVVFAGHPIRPAAGAAGDVRVVFGSGGSLLLRLERWADGRVSGTSPVFGPLAFDTRWFRHVRFNLDQPWPERGASLGPAGEDDLPEQEDEDE